MTRLLPSRGAGPVEAKTNMHAAQTKAGLESGSAGSWAGGWRGGVQGNRSRMTMAEVTAVDSCFIPQHCFVAAR
jgi:hypothetical protein